MPIPTTPAKLTEMTERSETSFRSGDALFAVEPDLTIAAWNAAAEQLTGIRADDAVGRYCWEVIGGHDDRGTHVCHQGCSTARLAREGWPVPCQLLHVKADGGRAGSRYLRSRSTMVSVGSCCTSCSPRVLHLRRWPSP